MQPAGPSLWVRYRTTGAEWVHWPVSKEEAQAVMNPGPQFEFSIGRAFGSIIKAHKSGRQVSAGERTGGSALPGRARPIDHSAAQPTPLSHRSPRRWLA